MCMSLWSEHACQVMSLWHFRYLVPFMELMVLHLSMPTSKPALFNHHPESVSTSTEMLAWRWQNPSVCSLLGCVHMSDPDQSLLQPLSLWLVIRLQCCSLITGGGVTEEMSLPPRRRPWHISAWTKSLTSSRTGFFFFLNNASYGFSEKIDTTVYCDIISQYGIWSLKRTSISSFYVHFGSTSTEVSNVFFTCSGYIKESPPPLEKKKKKKIVALLPEVKKDMGGDLLRRRDCTSSYINWSAGKVINWTYKQVHFDAQMVIENTRICKLQLVLG